MSTYTTPRQRPSVRNLTLSSSAGNTPTQDIDIEVGDTVEVPGGMDGTVRFIGEVRGKKGRFVGVELSEQYAARGKNSGDAEGVRYFSTSIPGAGIFLPATRAVKKDPHSPSTSSIPPTPTTPGFTGARQTDASPTPAMPSISKSLLGRAPSPALRPNSRPSLPRPESPIRRSNMPAPPRPPSAANSRPSLTSTTQNRSVTAPRFTASPAPGRSITKTPSKAALTSRTFRAPSRTGGGGGESDADELAQLRALLQEKNDRIKQLTVDFDNHRADFRNTLDALEMASTETQRVYESKVAELEAANEAMARERGEFGGDQGDFDLVAKQLRDVEITVQELEEGLEDARRGEAEARGEVEFLRGEVERLRAELRWEREQGEKALEEREREWQRSKSRSGTNGVSSSSSSSAAAAANRRFSTDQHSRSPEQVKSPAGAGGGAARAAARSSPPIPPAAAISSLAAGAASAAPTSALPERPAPLASTAATTPADATQQQLLHEDAEERPVTAYGPSTEVPPAVGTPRASTMATSAGPATASTAATAAPLRNNKSVDEDKWCALCEQDGHDVTECPSENML